MPNASLLKVEQRIGTELVFKIQDMTVCPLREWGQGCRRCRPPCCCLWLCLPWCWCRWVRLCQRCPDTCGAVFMDFPL